MRFAVVRLDKYVYSGAAEMATLERYVGALARQPGAEGGRPGGWPAEDLGDVAAQRPDGLVDGRSRAT